MHYRLKIRISHLRALLDIIRSETKQSCLFTKYRARNNNINHFNAINIRKALNKQSGQTEVVPHNRRESRYCQLSKQAAQPDLLHTSIRAAQIKSE